MEGNVWFWSVVEAMAEAGFVYPGMDVVMSGERGVGCLVDGLDSEIVAEMQEVVARVRDWYDELCFLHDFEGEFND